MKVLSCASYDYMKLMVLELEQQLAELDDVERLTASYSDASVAARAPPPAAEGSVGGESGEDLLGGPSRPPRVRQQQQLQQRPAPPPPASSSSSSSSSSRPNPFNQTLPGGGASVATAAAVVDRPWKSFNVLHAEIGVRIKRDREEWLKKKGQQKRGQDGPLIELT